MAFLAKLYREAFEHVDLEEEAIEIQRRSQVAVEKRSVSVAPEQVGND